MKPPTEEQHNAVVIARSLALSECASAYGRELRTLATLESYVHAYGESIGDPTLSWTHASHPSGAKETMTLATAELRKAGVFRDILARVVHTRRGEVRTLRARLNKLMLETSE